MRLPCLFVVLPAAVVLAGCATPAPPRYADALAQDVTQQPGVDALMYGAAQPASPAVRQVAQVMAPLEPYTLDAGDRLRIVVFGQDALSNSYIVGASGVIAVPLVGTIPARGLTTTQLAGAIAARLRRGFVRDPSVSVEVETYRPFFVLGEVTYPGQYPYVPDMTVESAVAIAGGFTPRALRNQAEVTRRIAGAPARLVLPLTERLRPGDTITIGERWF
jgi:polysaccharide export outer membrane protein